MPPVVIAAGIGAAAGIGGGILSANAQKRAAGKAADTSLAVAQQNNALQEKIYGQNKDILNPYVTRGNEAGSAINALLGISGTTAAAPATNGSGVPQVNPGYRGPLVGGVSSAANGSTFDGGEQAGGPRTFATHLMERLYAQNGLQPPGTPTPTVPAQTAGAPGTGAIPGQTPYQNAFQNYLNSTGYQFQIDQGNKGINQGYAARGSLQSGAALKALQTYGQNTATGFFKDYLGLLSNQQGVGLSGANAIAGVGTNYANSVSANNNNAGSAAANAYLAQGNATAGLYGNIAGAIGGVANVYGSSYRPGG